MNEKYVVISDAHLGQDGKDGTGFKSILSDLRSDKFLSFKEEISKFAGRDNITLIGVGDILDLSVSYMKDALDQFYSLMQELKPVNDVKLIIGNHDHHIYSMQCEFMHTTSALSNKTIPQPGSLYASLENIHSFLFSYSFPISISYPTLSLDIGSKKWLFTHGHLFGDLYTIISDILAPELKGTDYNTATATTNVAIIEFIYWLLGETGCGMGADGIIEKVHAEASKGKTSLVNELITRAIDVLIPKGVISWIPDRIEKWLIKRAACLVTANLIKEPSAVLLSSRDRHNTTSETRKKELIWMSKTLSNNKRDIIVTGHTHEKDKWSLNNIIHINLGSWLIEPHRPNPEAVALFIDAKKDDYFLK